LPQSAKQGAVASGLSVPSGEQVSDDDPRHLIDIFLNKSLINFEQVPEKATLPACGVAAIPSLR
jgi:hypothetical protein